MRLRVTILLRSIVLLLICVFPLAASAQIRADARPLTLEKAQAEAHASVELDLCVEGGTNADMCPAPPVMFETFVPYITYTYGQVLNGIVYFPRQNPDGTATISANGLVFCRLDLVSHLTCPADSTNFDPGVYTIILLYTDPDTGISMAGAPVVVTVLQDVTATFTLSSSLNPSPVGAPVTFTATALGTYSEPATGTIAFSDGGTPLGTGILNLGGMATLTTSNLGVGTHTIQAAYPGSIDLTAPPDALLTQVVLPPMTVTTIASSLNPSVFGDNVTFTADVTATSPGLHPTGAVSFDDGTSAFATVQMSAQGVAKASISTLAAGTHNITASYSGDAANGTSTSTVLVQQVDYPLTEATPGFIVTVTPSPVVLGVGLTANLTVTVTPKSGFSQPVTLTCGNLPRESTCTFGQAVFPTGGGSTTLDLTVASPHDCGSSSPYFYGANRPGSDGFMQTGVRYGAPALAGVFLLLFPRRRRWQKTLLALCACLGLMGLSGCSSTCTDFGTYPGSYTFIVTGTAPAATSVASPSSGTPLVVQTSVALTVKI